MVSLLNIFSYSYFHSSCVSFLLHLPQATDPLTLSVLNCMCVVCVIVVGLFRLNCVSVRLFAHRLSMHLQDIDCCIYNHIQIHETKCKIARQHFNGQDLIERLISYQVPIIHTPSKG